MELQVFQNAEFGSVRTTTVNGEVMFVAKDAATILGYTNTAKAIRDHIDDEDKLTERIVLSGQNREVIFINESGLYSLILSSKMPNARKFKRWVTAEVLPAIRRHGMYATEELIANPDLAIAAFHLRSAAAGSSLNAFLLCLSIFYNTSLCLSNDMKSICKKCGQYTYFQ